MLNLFEEINNLNNCDYYAREKVFPIAKINNWNLDNEHKNFIETFLKLSGKIEIIEFFKIDLDRFTRSAHTNSVFFLGCLFYEKLIFKDAIDFTRDGRDEFHFIWFLTSLMHDFGDDIESNKNEYLRITNELSSLIKGFSIKENLCNRPTDDYSQNMKTLIDYIPTYYEERFDGKQGRSNNGKIDHGIASGLILYDALVQNRKDKKEKYGENDKKHNLYWGSDLDKFYAIASYSIAVHNIRYPKNALKFSIEEDSFLFLFWLADTIEPIKSFQCCKPHYVLENISIEFNSDRQGFTIKNVEDSNLDFTEYKKKIKGLEKFLGININIENTNEVVLSWQFDTTNQWSQ